MENKWLIVVAVVLGIISLAVLPGIITHRAPVEERGALIDAGHFAVDQNGIRILEERYTLFSHPVEGYMLLSQGEITIGHQSISLAQQTGYASDFHPILYNLCLLYTSPSPRDS